MRHPNILNFPSLTFFLTVSSIFSLVMVASTLLALAPKIAMAAPAQSYTISGTVRNYDGTPLQGLLVSTDLLDPEIATTNTDSQGKYTFTVATPGAYHISVNYYYSALDPAVQTVTIPPSHTKVDFTFAQHDIISGVVKDPKGNPVAGANITTDIMDSLSTSTSTDANGAYSLAVLPGIYHLSASLSGYVSPPAQRIVVPPSHTEVNFSLLDAYTIQGKVLTFDGQPASGITVASSEDDVMTAYATTEPDGSYILYVRAGTYHLYATFVGLGTTQTQVVTVPANRTGVDFAMPQQYLVHGTVRDDLGRPVVGAFVNEGGAASATTAADGSYTLSLVAGDHWINAFSDVQFYNAYDSGDQNIKLISVPLAKDGLDFVLRVRNRTIVGRVVDDQGQPVAIADVYATNPLDSSGQVRESDANGFYTLTVAAGVYWVNVVKQFSPFDHNPNRLTPFNPSFSQEIDVTSDSAQGVNFALDPVTGLQTIQGKVRDALGNPVQAIVSATSTDPNSCALGGRVLTDESGNYTIAAKPGEYMIGVWSDGLPVLPDQRVHVPSTTGVDFTYPPFYVISGRVATAQGNPIANALVQVRASGSNGIYNSRLSERDGWYTLIVAAGSYNVTAYHEAFAQPSSQQVTVLPERNDINFTLSPIAPPTQYVQGKVVDETGEPAGGALISLPGEVGKTVYYDGTFRRAFYPGTYTLTASGNTYMASAPQQITVPPNQTGLVFTVRRADQFIFGQVVDEGGAPLCNVTVEISGEAAAGNIRTNISGRFAVRVPSGVYSIRALKDGNPATPAQTVTVPPTAAKIKLVLSSSQTPVEGNSVKGSVVDNNNAVVANALVIATSAGQTISTTTDAQGNYTLNLADGNWRISVSGDPVSRTVSVPPQQEQVDFQVKRVVATTFVYLPAVITNR